MLDRYIPNLIKDLGLESSMLANPSPGVYVLPLDVELSVTMTQTPEGMIFKSQVAPYPKTDIIQFSTEALRANLFGDITHGASLGMTLDGEHLTLTHNVDYYIDYKGFRDILEDFINSVDFWHDEALSHK